MAIFRDPPIMLEILRIMLCCTAQKFAYYNYALLIVQNLPIMLSYVQYFIPQFPCFAIKFVLHS